MYVLTFEEAQEVKGGIAPVIIAAGIAAAGAVTAAAISVFGGSGGKSEATVKTKDGTQLQCKAG